MLPSSHLSPMNLLTTREIEPTLADAFSTFAAAEPAIRLPPGCPVEYVDHHRAHAATAFYSSPFRDATIVVCDRSVLDNYAYMVLACGRQRWLERLINHWMKSYDLLFKVPVSGEAAADGVRDTDDFFIRSIDQLVDGLLQEKRVAHERLPSGERDAWIGLVKDEVLKHPDVSKLF